MRYLPQYIYMGILLLLVQVGLMNNLSFGVYLSPMPYIALMIVLPIDMPRLWQLLVALALGVVVDLMVGHSSLNTIATLAVGFIRPYLLGSMNITDGIEGGGLPTELRLGRSNMRKLVVRLVVLHNLIYFAFESLSVVNLELTALRFALSTLFSLVAISLSVRLFNSYTRKA